jgi:hypothetical protein
VAFVVNLFELEIKKMAIKDWTKQEILEVYNTPLMELIYHAAEVHKQHHTVGEVQISSLLSIKTGGCPEDCSYCPQAARYHTEVKVHKLMSVPEVDEAANNAKAGGASRMCLGAAWREVRDNKDFDTVLDMVKTINSKGLEVCATLGMVTEDQAKQQGVAITKGMFPWAASGRAIANGRDEGFTKLLFDAATHKILGGGIVGTNAGDLISEVALAIEMGADMVDIGKTIHPHPTLGESVGLAAEAAEGHCTDLPPVKKK